MKMTLRIVALVLATFSFSALGQIGNYPALIGQKGATAPSTCAVGQLFFDTDATAGSNILGCTAANVWTAQGSSGIATGSAVTGGGANRVLYEDASQLLAASASWTYNGTDTWLFGAHNLQSRSANIMSLLRSSDSSGTSLILGDLVVLGNTLTVNSGNTYASQGNRLFTTAYGAALASQVTVGMASGGAVGWRSSATEAYGSFDTALTRGAAGQVNFGTGAAGSTAGAVSANQFIIPSTGTKAAPSIVSSVSSNDGYWVNGAGHTMGFTSSGNSIFETAGSGWNLYPLWPIGWPGSGDASSGRDTGMVRGQAANQIVFGGGGTLASGPVTSRTEFNKSVTGIADATGTATFTVTVPNAAHSGMLKTTLDCSLGAGGAIGANEATATISYDIAITRVAGVNAAAAISTAYGSAATAVAGAATVTVTGALSAISGAVGATNTFTVNATVTKSGGSSANHTCLVYGRLMNANATGITIQ